jgi:hypothetical protein
MPELKPGGDTPSMSQTHPTGLKPAIKSTKLVPGERDDSVTRSEIALPTVSKYLDLLQQSKFLIQSHGRYTTYAGTTVFSRAPMTRDVTTDTSSMDLAISLAAAQDCIGSAQPEGPARDDLAIF